MSQVREEIEVDVPVSVAFNQWTQFESFPEFMDGVKMVRQIDDRRVHWVADVAGKREEWDATITHQEPDREISWSSTDGARNAGSVKFSPLGPGKTCVGLEMMTRPESTTEKIGSALGFDDRTIRKDLENFKKFIEARGTSTGAWRGEINPRENPH
jgi:uncharacterized membrane protein